MRLFRRKLPLDTAMQLMLGAVVRRIPRQAVADIAAAGTLPPDRLDAVVEALPAFDVAVWHQLCVTFAGRDVPPEDLSRRFTAALEAALRAALPPDEAMERFEGLRAALLEYLRSLGSHSPEEIARDGPFAILARHFTDVAMRGVSAPDADIQRQRAQVHQIAWEGYRSALSTFSALGQAYRITVRP